MRKHPELIQTRKWWMQHYLKLQAFRRRTSSKHKGKSEKDKPQGGDQSRQHNPWKVKQIEAI
eukprot:12924092-Prorocentrum_lima.AAC.1